MATFPRGHWADKTTTHNNDLKASLTRQTIQTNHGKITWIVTAGDEATLRGIPAIGRGVQGAIAGTNPSRIGDQ